MSAMPTGGHMVAGKQDGAGIPRSLRISRRGSDCHRSTCAAVGNAALAGLLPGMSRESADAERPNAND
jgi:hypothetical protein